MYRISIWICYSTRTLPTQHLYPQNHLSHQKTDILGHLSAISVHYIQRNKYILEWKIIWHLKTKLEIMCLIIAPKQSWQSYSIWSLTREKNLYPSSKGREYHLEKSNFIKYNRKSNTAHFYYRKHILKCHTMQCGSDSSWEIFTLVSD